MSDGKKSGKKLYLLKPPIILTYIGDEAADPETLKRLEKFIDYQMSIHGEMYRWLQEHAHEFR